MTKIKTTLLSDQEFLEMEGKPPSKYHIRTALGYLFIHVRDRAAAIEYTKNEYGGKYTVRCSSSDDSRVKVADEEGLGSMKKDYSAVGRINSRSRAGSRSVN